MPEPTQQQLLAAAAKAPTTAEAAQYVQQADALRARTAAQHAAAREVDLANAVIAEHLTPAMVHEHHTAATDWLGSIDTTGGEGVADEMVAQASLWYGRVAAIRPWREEFEEQARGVARKLAGAYGVQAAAAEEAFLGHTAALYARELAAGIFVEAASGLPQVGDEGAPVAEATVGPTSGAGLPLEQTTSDRAPMMQAMEHNTSSGIHDATGPNTAEADNTGQDRVRTQGSRHTADGTWAEDFGQRFDDVTHGVPAMHPGVGGFSAVPVITPMGEHTYTVRTQHGRGSDFRGMRHELRSDLPDAHWEAEQQAIHDHAARFGIHPDEVESKPALRRGEQPNHYGSRGPSMPTAPCPSCRGRGRVAVRTEAASGLTQVQEVVDPHDNAHAEQQPDWDVMFPWEMPENSQDQINQAEKQIADREKLKGASRQRRAEAAAQEVYRRILAGQDDSGWLGDMGAGGVAPGEQDGGNPGPPSNLGQPDPVYGYGGDQGDRAIKPYGADEANDVTNNPGMGYQPGQPAQYDQGGRGMTTGASLDADPEIQRALAFVRNRRAFLTQGR